MAKACINQEAGSATVELALLMPMIVAMILLAANVGVYWTIQQTVYNAASSAARIYATTGDWAQARGVADTITEDLKRFGGGSAVIDMPPVNNRGGRVTATVNYTMPVHLLIIPAQQALITGKAVTWKER